MAAIRNQLLCEQRPSLNLVNRYAMLVKKDSCITVSHLPWKIALLSEEVRYGMHRRKVYMPYLACSYT